MAARLILTIGSFFFLFLLLTALFSRKLDLKLSNKIYVNIIVLLMIFIFSEICSFLLYVYSDYTLVAKIALRINWLIAFAVYYMFHIYNIVSLYDLNSFKIKEDKRLKTFTIITIIFIIIYFILPFKNMSKMDFEFLPGPAAYVVSSYIFISIMSCFYDLYKKKDASKTNKLMVYILLLIMSITFTFQLIFREIAFLSVSSTIEVFFLYFLIENPDIRLTKNIDELKYDAERSSKAKSDFLSNMSHEIRSPMNSIIGFSDTSLNDPNNIDMEKIFNDVQHIKSSSKNLLDIINNILDISKIETGTDVLDIAEYNLKGLLIDWSSIVESRLEGKNIKFVLELDNSLPSKYIGDSTKMFQVVLNLLTNAVKYTEVGRIKMSLSGVKTNNGVNLLFKVADTGLGIKKEDYDKVFQKFQRLDSAKTNEIEGTGLGLVLTKRYAELMGGKIWFESEYRAGSTFYFEIPQKVADETPIGNISESILEDNSKQLLDCSGLRVLAVDDDALNLRVIKRLLGGYKLEVDTLQDPSECIFKVKSGVHYDLIFLDHMMHNMDGVEVLRILRNLHGYDIPPIIMLTANAINGVREMYLKEGFDEYLSKPIDVNELDKVINKYLKIQK